MANRLAGSTSPYLLQHQDNPVDWYPWGSEALERAQQEALPLLVSVGYSACHWCHVMERESFEDPETAAVMNANFVCIKVDREERPDVDGLYMEALQAMTGQGGWPMTVFCTPDGRPFHAGTYFPPTDRQGMPAFRRVLEGIAAGWRDQRAQVEEQGTQIAGYLGQLGRLATDGERPEEELLRQALAGLRKDFDPYWGGFGTAPKFPQPTVIELLMRLQVRGLKGALDPAIRTLRSLAIGGIQDHLAGGFHRYATDERWLVPHFEKMLYDNAQLLRVAVHAWQLTKDDRYAAMVRSTARWLLTEMRDSGGGFWSALDADSEGEEGRFYVWTYEELVAEVGDAVARCFGAVPEGNWEGRNVLWRPRPVEDVAKDLDLDPDELVQAVDEGRERLLAARAQRVRPATDDKVLAGWNGLTIGALAEAGRVFDEPEWLAAAEQAAIFVVENLRRPDGRLARTWRGGIVGPDAVAEDYGLLAEGCIALYEATGTVRWLEEARALAEVLIARFVDHEHGGFYQTASDAEQLLVRPKDVLDTALPSGNSAAAFALARLSRLDGDVRLEDAAWSAVQLITPFAGRSPLAVSAALCTVDFLIGPGQEVVVVGASGDPTTEQLLRAVWDQYLPNRVLMVATPEQAAAAGDDEPLLAGREMRAGVATAYVCEQFSCRAPLTDPEALARELQER